MQNTQNYTQTTEYTSFATYRATKDKHLRDALFERYVHIARILSKKYLNRGIEYDDIFQVASIGLLYAIERFDPDRGVRFATYATPTIVGEINKYFRDKGNIIRVPRALYELFYKAEQIRRHSPHEDSEMQELSRALNIPESDLIKIYNMKDNAFIKSLEYEAYADGTMTMSNIIGIEDDNYIMVENKNFIETAMKQLNQKELDFIRMRYHEEKSQSEIAQIWGISQMHVSRFEKAMLKKLRDMYFRD